MLDIMELAEKAVQTAHERDLIFDYSPESVSSLEKLAQMIYETNKSQHLPENVLWNAAVTYGVYLGETLLRNGLTELGFNWTEIEDGSMVLQRDRNWMSPINKVYKRFINGPEDNLEGFFEVSLALARGDIEL